MILESQQEYSEKLSEYYSKLLDETYTEFGKENMFSSVMCFNIILEGENNDFERSIELTKDPYLTAYNSRILGLILYKQGLFTKSLKFLSNALKIRIQINDRAGMAIDHGSIGLVLRDIGNYDEALVHLKTALQIHNEVHDRANVARDYTNTAIVLRNIGNYDEALEYHKKALHIDEELNDRAGMAIDYINIGLLSHDLGNYDEALEYHKKALAIHQELNDNIGIARDYANIAIDLHKVGNYDEALEYHKKALHIDEELNDRAGMAIDYINIGLLSHDLGNYDEALEYHKKALAIHQELNDRAGMAIDYINIGLLSHDLGNYDEALVHLKTALQIHNEVHDRANVARDYTNTAIVLRNIGNYDEALEYHKKALAIHQELNDRAGMAIDYINIGLLSHDLGNYDEALVHLKTALQIHNEVHDRANVARDYTNTAIVLRNIGNYDEALEYHKKALAIHQELNDRAGMAIDHVNLSNTLVEIGRINEAFVYLQKAMEIENELKKNKKLYENKAIQRQQQYLVRYLEYVQTYRQYTSLDKKPLLTYYVENEAVSSGIDTWNSRDEKFEENKLYTKSPIGKIINDFISERINWYLVIGSPPGVGKTSLARITTADYASKFLQEDLDKNHDYIPILVFLRNGFDNVYYQDSLENVLTSISISDKEHNRKILLILDGLDEYKGDIQTLMYDISSFRNVYPNMKVLITTTLIPRLPSIINIDSYVRLLPFTQSQVDEFFTKYGVNLTYDYALHDLGLGKEEITKPLFVWMLSFIYINLKLELVFKEYWTETMIKSYLYMLFFHQTIEGKYKYDTSIRQSYDKQHIEEKKILRKIAHLNKYMMIYMMRN